MDVPYRFFRVASNCWLLLFFATLLPTATLGQQRFGGLHVGRILFLGNAYNPLSIACLQSLLEDGVGTVVVGSLDRP